MRATPAELRPAPAHKPGIAIGQQARAFVAPPLDDPREAEDALHPIPRLANERAAVGRLGRPDRDRGAVRHFGQNAAVVKLLVKRKQQNLFQPQARPLGKPFHLVVDDGRDFADHLAARGGVAEQVILRRRLLDEGLVNLAVEKLLDLVGESLAIVTPALARPAANRQRRGNVSGRRRFGEGGRAEGGYARDAGRCALRIRDE